jgi:hypothetical protein
MRGIMDRHRAPVIQKLPGANVAWYSEMSVPELQRMAAQEAVRALNGEALQNRIA